MTDWRPIVDLSEMNLPDRRSRHALSVGDLSETDLLHQRPTCLIDNPSETDMYDPETSMPDLKPTSMPNRRHIGDRHA